MLRRVIEQSCPDEIYNLGAQSHVKVSFELPEYTADAELSAHFVFLRPFAIMCSTPAVKCGSIRRVRSEMFGAAKPPQNETTPFYPRSPYAVRQGFRALVRSTTAKAYGLFMPRTAFCSTTNRRGAAKRSSPARSRAPLRVSSWGCRRIVPRQSGRQARLGICRRLCRGDVADAAAG